MDRREPSIQGLGPRVHLFVRPGARGAFTSLFRDTLGCEVVERDFGLQYPVVLVSFSDGSRFSAEFTDLAPVGALRECARHRGSCRATLSPTIRASGGHGSSSGQRIWPGISGRSVAPGSRSSGTEEVRTPISWRLVGRCSGGSTSTTRVPKPRESSYGRASAIERALTLSPERQPVRSRGGRRPSSTAWGQVPTTGFELRVAGGGRRGDYLLARAGRDT
jgi:hypothetical protein